jgi:transposase-like protein
MDRGDGFKGRQFTAEVILWAVRWYLMFPIGTVSLTSRERSTG